MRSSAAIIAALLLLPAALSGAEPIAPKADLAQFDQAAAAHPDDPDLAWADAMAHLQAGDASAADRFLTFQARWPGLRPDGDLELGKALALAGRDAEALAAFDRALAFDPNSAPAELHRGLVLRRLGRTDEADQALQRAAALAPELAPETLLLRGISRIEIGEREEATRLLQSAIDLDPSGEAARRARELLPSETGSPPLSRWVSLMARTGIEYDSNVTLDSGLPIAGTGTNKADGSSVFGAGLVLRPLRTERFDLSLGYRFDGSLHLNLGDYDLLNHLAYLSMLYRATNRIALRFDGVYDRSMLGGGNYGESTLARQNMFVSFGERGVTRIYADVAHQSYFEKPTLSSLDRDGNEYGLGVEHSFVVPGWRSTLLTVGTRVSRFDSEAQQDLIGFDGAYDDMRYEGNVALRLPLVWKIWATAGLSLAYEHYDNPNVIDFLTDNNHGDPTPSARRDWVAEAALSLVRPITNRIDAELGWHYTHRDSNVDLYAYDRNLVGLYFTVHSD